MRSSRQVEGKNLRTRGVGGKWVVVVVLECLRCANVQRSRPSYATTKGTEVAAWGRLHMSEERARRADVTATHSLTLLNSVSEVPSCTSHVMNSQGSTRWRRW